jgi:hypothetical protein
MSDVSDDESEDTTPTSEKVTPSPQTPIAKKNPVGRPKLDKK